MTPKSTRDRVGGAVNTGDAGLAMVVRVRAVADKGKANTSVRKALAVAFDVPQSAVRILAGHTTRIKTVAIAGDSKALFERAINLAG